MALPLIGITTHAPGAQHCAALDGLVEAVELADHPFALAVQWHPEALPGVAEQRALFEACVAACK